MDSRNHLDAQPITSDAGGLLPVQYRDTVRPAAPAELRLMAAVMKKAIDDFRCYALDPRAVGRELFRLASHWIASSDRSWPYSFENICGVFDIDPHHLRRALVRDRTARAGATPRSAEQCTIVLTPRSRAADATWAAGDAHGGQAHRGTASRVA